MRHVFYISALEIGPCRRFGNYYHEHYVTTYLNGQTVHRIGSLVWKKDTGRASLVWSGREDLNLRPLRPERSALPGCATPRQDQAEKPNE
jgi:hypothetical protein